MKESIEKRVSIVKETEDYDDLRKHLCPFFDKGGHPDCLVCRKTEADLDECRDYYLERIALIPMDTWSEEFDKFLVLERDKIDLEEVVGIGITCDNCAMYDKCPLYKKGYSCGIKWDNNRPATPTDFLDFLINTQYDRVRRAAVFEKVEGGVPDALLSGEMDRLRDLVGTKVDMGRDRLSINVEATGAARSGGGILSQLFGGGKAIEAPKTLEIPEKAESMGEVIDYEEIKPIEEVAEKLKVPRKRRENHGNS